MAKLRFCGADDTAFDEKKPILPKAKFHNYLIINVNTKNTFRHPIVYFRDF